MCEHEHGNHALFSDSGSRENIAFLHEAAANSSLLVHQYFLTALSEHVCVTVRPALADEHDDVVLTRSPITWACSPPPPSPSRSRRQRLEAMLSGADVAGDHGVERARRSALSRRNGVRPVPCASNVRRNVVNPFFVRPRVFIFSGVVCEIPRIVSRPTERVGCMSDGFRSRLAGSRPALQGEA